MTETFPATRVEVALAHIRGRIAERPWAEGERLPSVRRLSDALGFSKSTVVDAYDRLVAEGALTARRGSGFYVARTERKPLMRALDQPPLDRAIDPLWVMRHVSLAKPGTPAPGQGCLPESWMPDDSVQKALHATTRLDARTRLNYDEPLGYAPLRELLAGRESERGVRVAADQIILTDSATQALDFVLRFLVAPGDVVAVDEPTYFNFRSLLRAHRAEITSIPITPEGPDLAAMEQVFASRKPKLYISIGGPHNPTGATISAARAHQVLKLAERHDVLVCEDDVFADFEPVPGPRLAGFDGLDRVVRIGALTKTVSGALRAGYIMARPEWIEPLIDVKLATTLGNSRGTAAVVHHVLTQGGFRRHLDALRAKLSAATGRTLRRLNEAGLTPWTEPRCGIFIWAKLPEGVDAAHVARAGLERGVIFAPGQVFGDSSEVGRYLRFNVAHCASPIVWETLDFAIGRTRERKRS